MKSFTLIGAFSFASILHALAPAPAYAADCPAVAHAPIVKEPYTYPPNIKYPPPKPPIPTVKRVPPGKKPPTLYPPYGGGGVGGSQVNLPPIGCFTPPAMNNPLIINKCPEEIGGQLATGGRDVILELPDRVCTGSLNVHDTGNVIIRGGTIRLGNKGEQNVISIHNIAAGKNVYLEGLELNANGANADIIRTYRANNVNVYVQNTVAYGNSWGHPHHADCFHAQGGGALGNLVMQNYSCISGNANNGLQVTYRPGFGGVGTKRLILDRVDISGTRGASLNFSGTGSAASKAMKDSPPPNGAEFRDFYVQNAPSKVYERPNYQSGGGGDCNNYGTWNKPYVKGRVCNGLPSGNGHFATPGTTGRNYDRSRFCQN